MLLTLLAAAVIAVPNAPEVGATRPKIIAPGPACPNLRPVLTPAAGARTAHGAKAYDNRPDVVIVGPSLPGPVVPMFGVPHPLIVEPPAALCSATPASPPVQYR